MPVSRQFGKPASRTYSSIYVASPVSLALGVSKSDLAPVKKEGAERGGEGLP